MEDTSDQSILRLESVSLQATVGSDFLLQDISINFLAGSKTAVVGASGAGKTSLLKLLNSLTLPSQGKIYFQGLAVKELSSIKLRQSVVLVPQEPKLLGMSVADVLAYPLQLQQLAESEIRSRIDTWVDLIGIKSEWLNKTELQLSLGQRQLVTIARGLVMQPQVLLLDEPTSALDIGTATNLMRVLTEINHSQNLTIVMVNHQLELVKNFCDRLLFLNQGKLEYELDKKEIDWQKLEQEMLRSRWQQEQDWD